MTLTRSARVGILAGLAIAFASAGTGLLFEMRGAEPGRRLQDLLILTGAGPLELLDLILAPTRASITAFPDVFLWIFFFVYWAAVGGGVGWLLGQRQAARRTAAVLVIAGLLLWHSVAKEKFERDLEAALEGAITTLATQLAPVLGAVGEQYLKEHAKKPAS